MNNIILYTIGCPRCNVLEKKLQEANIEYEVCEDQNVMARKGFQTLPILEVNHLYLNFKEAVDWIKERGI